MVEFGTDYSMNAIVNERGDIKTVADFDNLRQRIHNILLVPYNYYGDEFGSNLWNILGSDLNKSNVKLAALYIQATLKKDERIKEVNITNMYINIKREVVIGISVTSYDDEEINTNMKFNQSGLIEIDEED